MPQLILNGDALRVSVRMRTGFGWYPTEKDNESQLKLFESSVMRLKESLQDKEGPVTPNNMRKSLKTLHEICHTEADVLWEHVTSSESDDFKDVLDSNESCVSYAYALAFAIEACFDDYLRKKRQEKFDAVEREMNKGHQGHHESYPDWNEGSRPPVRSRSRGPRGPPGENLGHSSYDRPHHYLPTPHWQQTQEYLPPPRNGTRSPHPHPSRQRKY
jgi:hypothetical protein